MFVYNFYRFSVNVWFSLLGNRDLFVCIDSILNYYEIFPHNAKNFLNEIRVIPCLDKQSIFCHHSYCKNKHM